ncbi:hypothetical protein ACS0TY_024640 [Phlomoides rotata]
MTGTTASPFDSSLTLQAMTHMVTVKLTSTNYLLWYTQAYPLLFSQKFLAYVDGFSFPPTKVKIAASGSASPNPDYTKWYLNDQIIRVFLSSTLSEEALSVVIGCTSSREIWDTLATTFNRPSKARELRIRDELQFLKKGARSVTEYGSTFKNLCDQLSAMGRPLDATDQSHWFLHGLGSEFQSFSATYITMDSLPSFHTLLSLVESYDLFARSMGGIISASHYLFLTDAAHFTISWCTKSWF